MWGKMSPFESDILDLECQLADAQAVRPWASHFPSLGFRFLMCKAGIITLITSWVAGMIIDKITWFLMHRGARSYKNGVVHPFYR